jgi:hypothetical protein
VKLLLLAFLAAVSLKAGTDPNLVFYVHTPGQTADGPALGGAYNFPDTAIGDSSSVVLRLKNISATQTYVIRAVFTSSPDFPVGGSVLNMCLIPSASEDVTISFTPSAIGVTSDQIEIGYAVSPGCAPPGNVSVETLAALSGNGVAPVLNVSLTLNGNTSVISSGNTIAFGQVPVGGTSTATITVQNGTTATLPIPAPAVVAAVFSQSPFAIGSLTNFPPSLAPGASASFTVSFSPNQQALLTGTLTIGSRSYPLTGFGIPGEGLSSLIVSYTLPTGVHYTISPATPVDFGSVTTGSSGKFIFTIQNPATNFSPQIIPNIALSGSGFTLDSVPALPLTVNPGGSASFNVIFAPASTGTATATLSIGTLQYTLTGKVADQALNPLFQFSPQSLSSDQQAQISLSLGTAPQSTVIGTLTLSFKSAVPGATDDPAIQFVSTGGRSLNVTFAAGSTAGAFPGGTSSATFQTGVTAGTLTFALSFPNGQSYTKSLDINPLPVQVVSASAQKQSPYLLINITAYDNTYSASSVVFHFYDTNGAPLTPSGITYDGTQTFKNYFFTNNQSGGGFSLQARFPVTGDITTVAAADVTIQNVSGQSQTQHVTF